MGYFTHTNYFRYKLLFYLVAFLMGLPLSGQGQTAITVTGHLTDLDTKEAIPGATIRVKDTDQGTVTDINGAYSIVVPANATLLFTFLGYESLEVPVNGRRVISNGLRASAKALNEVVVVGYTQTKRSALTSAITTVTAKELSQAAYTSVNEKLQGQVPGLLISSNSGVPGTTALVRLRGATSITAGNDPLYVIDGVFVNNESLQGLSRGLGGQVSNPLSDLNPEDIESVSVLKDANATALYGARGANGVILISTRKPQRQNQRQPAGRIRTGPGNQPLGAGDGPRTCGPGEPGACERWQALRFAALPP